MWSWNCCYPGGIRAIPWGCSWYFEEVLAPSRHLKWCIDKRWWQPICELIGELMKEEMPARWARPLPGGESAPPPTFARQEGESRGAACTLLSVPGLRPRGVTSKKVCATRSCPSPPLLLASNGSLWFLGKSERCHPHLADGPSI